MKDSKQCSKCKEIKHFSMYHAKPKGKFGLHSICKPCRSIQSIEWAKRNPDRSRDIQRDAKRRIRETEEGRKKLSRINGEYAKRHPQRIARKIRERADSDPVYKASIRARGVISRAIGRRGYTKRSRSAEILGCDWIFFKKHIERQFLIGMSWDRMNEIHIDHIIPIATAKTEEDVLRLNHFTNLRPMWAADNMNKGAKVEYLL